MTKKRAAITIPALLAVAVLAGILTRTGSVHAEKPQPEPKQVTIVEFDSNGKRLGKSTVPQVVKSEEEWRAELSEQAYKVTRQAGTEFAHTGKYNKHYETGVYRCIACGTALFHSKTKYDSRSGWPSYWAPIARQNISVERDTSLGMEREAVLCKRCNAHLGHVFPDGPRPTGLRYCVNSAAMSFEAAE